MTYEEAREFISQSNQYGLVPGLETITELLQQLNNPQEQLKIVHVAGTNGKGSVCAFLASILAVAGYRVGRYISPAVYSYRERIQIAFCNDDFIDVECITKEGVIKTIEQIKPACESMVRDGYPHPTSFEIETAMTFLYLLWEQVDIVVLEVGLGGRLDATNVIKHPAVCVITSISMDHMQYLGDTLEKIASEKAGIIKEGVPVVTCRQEDTVLRVMEQKAGELHAPFSIADSDNIKKIRYSLNGTEFSYSYDHKKYDYKIKLMGEYQVTNAFLASQAARILMQEGYNINEDKIRKGLSITVWPGRFEVISERPYVIIDGAHNADAALTLRKSIEIYFTNRRIIYIIGVLADKDYKSILKITLPLAEMVITLTPDNNRALSSAELAKEAGVYCDRVIDAGNTEQAIRFAYQEAGENDVIIAFGSLSFLGSLVSTLRLRKDEIK